ncbi:hypothetical protein BsIDN1_45270 [Bacillus safensis]|uniref:Uncharacterized protein n=1 Tax=Bacillus safensis TaxID=561879 RepID=A0A5S9MGG9_BACIA|nr:hypothetical protein BsIDN1_45270 [Bacillus safensis]
MQNSTGSSPQSATVGKLIKVKLITITEFVLQKDALGIVHVTGAIAGGTLGDVPAFTLPEGCEPPFPLYNVGIASSTGGFKGPQFSRQYIATDGRFCIQDTTSNTEFIVVNCVFKAKEG